MVMKSPYEARGLEKRYIVTATPQPPAMRSTVAIMADWVLIEMIASTAKPTLSANTSLTTPNTVKPLSVAR